MNERPTITEVNCATGEVITRPYNDDDLAQHEKDLVTWAKEKEERETQEEARAAAKASAEAKLAALGLTAEEIAAL